ncbi:uncharacterized protein LOC129791449 [Lutzomyia longipalpis]|uniref:uncharacterized protein LOC129791449 n=1 Tax=Lutzomyia longipalpis TaxID=7200 RepID=UPI00248454EA|nr:uncharacterized protein LOC129791449 [Lutzomyia longipalpis]
MSDIKARVVPGAGQNCNGQTGNGVHLTQWKHPEVRQRSPGQKGGGGGNWNVIEISSSSENEEDRSETQTPSPSSLGNGADGSGKGGAMGRWAVRSQGHNMLRRDYGKKAPYRIFQMPTPQANVARKEEFYNYLGIYTKPPFAKTVDMDANFLKRRSLRVCFIKKRKEHTAKMSALEQEPAKNASESPAAPLIAKEAPSGSAGSSPVTTDSSTIIMERRNYILQANSASDEEVSIVTHKVSDLSHQTPNGDAVQGRRSISEKTAMEKRAKSRKNLRKRKRMHKKLFKTTYFIRSSARSCVLRSGKVRDPDLSKIDLIRKLQKQRHKKSKEESSSPVSPKPVHGKEAAAAAQGSEVIVVTDDEDPVEIISPPPTEKVTEKVVPAPEEPKKPRILNEDQGQVLGVHLTWPTLLIFQEELISFWTMSEIACILSGRQEWKKAGEVKRITRHEEIPTAISKRILHTDKFGCAYVEMRAQPLQKIARQEADYTAMHIHVYYLQNGKGTVQTIELDRVCGLPQDMCYTTVPDVLSFVVTWHERVTPIKSRTGAVRYTLTPNLETLASIWDFNPVDNRVRSLSVATEQRVIGVGDHHVTVWNYSTANLLINIDLKSLELGDNLFTYMLQELKTHFLLLTQLHCNTIHTVAINLLDLQYVILHTHENVGLTIDSLRSSAMINGCFVGAFAGGEVLLLKAHQSDFLWRKSLDRKNVDVFISGEYVVEIGQVIAIRGLMEFLAVCG